jgi:hypothetical protein
MDEIRRTSTWLPLGPGSFHRLILGRMTYALDFIEDVHGELPALRAISPIAHL